MADFDFKTYMAECAVKLKAIGHSDLHKKFFVVSSISALEGLLSQLTEAEFPALIIHDSQEGSFGDALNSQNFLDKPDFTFYVVDKVKKINDTDRMEEVKRNCKSWGMKIISRMLYHKKQAVRSGDDPHGLQLFEKRNIAYQTVGPIGNNCFGVMFFITVPKQADVEFDQEDWSE